jgi:LacI family transcriptional regulator
VTLRDVALASGVSTYTVSKVVGGQAAAARIAPATVERVLAKAAELGYVPNGVARNLRAQRTGQIGVVLYTIDNMAGPERDTFEGALLRGVHVASEANGLLPRVVYTSFEEPAAGDPVGSIGSRVDGLLIRCVHHRHAVRLLGHASPSLPMVAIWYRDVPDHMGYVDIDHYGGARLAVEHLLRLGHRRIAYMGPPLNYDHPSFALRCQAYRDTLQAAGIIPQPEWHVDTVEAILALRRGAEPITAVFATQDKRAGALIAAFREMGGRVPDDLSVVGFDNVVNADPWAGGLTTIHQPIEEMGAEAVRCLAVLLQGGSVTACRTILPAHLVQRHTTAPLTGGGV